MKSHQKVIVGVVLMLLGVAFLPLAAEVFAESFTWKTFANLYQDINIHLPVVINYFSP